MLPYRQRLNFIRRSHATSQESKLPRWSGIEISGEWGWGGIEAGGGWRFILLDVCYTPASYEEMAQQEETRTPCASQSASTRDERNKNDALTFVRLLFFFQHDTKGPVSA